ncbi:MAG: alkyl hydroperoxide reductase [Deltaproteobacteria bacterium RIFCSPLOWO2_01_44_7]|nr:MAG: alkyl hydroperoxide reductase [Deltaproteobacteria bacterium RIFCSPHIGHO2_01_FULL_43_49]OGQ16493.1 MAG: alkyl hydroperoxide reductase [Deltaproteobacteria bacterium RIFCSPHIGHO2_02_FULL_44_53]OGQ29331.1 MAG: alkyl hydroperoxide reductase [Deltaproteobacteria bacterium RIFCSPHIGHO2_12_FULL_44_21]OGQ33011.1 MAG: alkyl hydroperoxide reductase [Deltaproteobacteria bacterium RIFCSPLOWO2_01_FULL_45_74]OGQ41451.1 MAG: alkyl hydroperoxide reductase [Deltaproteobacteria bacterium RIFCSPLOWO2_01_
MAFQSKTQLLEFGAAAPDFNLPGVDGKTYRLWDYKNKAKAVVIIFACNHCPYVLAYEDRMIQISKDYVEKGVQFFVINANETKNYPEDSFEKMKERTKIKKFPYPYLRDEDQKVAESFGAGCTPEVFLLDSALKLQYHGRIDDNWQEPAQAKQHYLREALNAVLEKKPVSRPETHPIGCSIKWSS